MGGARIRSADGSTRLVVAERAERAAFEDGEIADWIRDARRLSTLEHPNVARVQDVVIRSGDVLVVSEFIDGVRWNEIAATATLETALRIVADTLAGLSAIHSLRDPADPKRQLFRLVHGALTPDCVIVGLDGVARIVGAIAPEVRDRAPRGDPERVPGARGASGRRLGRRSGGRVQRRSAAVGGAQSAPVPAEPATLGDRDAAAERARPRRDRSRSEPLGGPPRRRRDAGPLCGPGEAIPFGCGDVLGAASDRWSEAPPVDPRRRGYPRDLRGRRQETARGARARGGAPERRVPAGIEAARGGLRRPDRRGHRGLADGVDGPPAAVARARPRNQPLARDRHPAAGRSAEAYGGRCPAETRARQPAAGRSAEARARQPCAGRSAEARGGRRKARERVDAPPKPVAVVAPPKPAPVSPAPAATGSPQPRAAAPAVEAAHAARPPTPSRSAPVQDAITAAGPFALATSAMLMPPEAPARAPKGMLRILIGGGAVLAIGAATWWVASPGPAPQPAEGRETPSAVARPAAAPVRASATETPAATPSGRSALTADPATTDSPWVPVPPIVPTPPNATAAATPPSPVRAAAPLLPVAPHPFPPASPVPAKPKRSPGHRGYDPEGI